MKKDYLYGYLFTFNSETGIWHTFKSDKMSDYFNKGESELSANNIDYIIETLGKNSIRAVDETNSKGY